MWWIIYWKWILLKTILRYNIGGKQLLSNLCWECVERSIKMFKCWSGLFSFRKRWRPAHTDYIDKSHCNLSIVPDDELRHERHLEELLLEANQIRELPRKIDFFIIFVEQLFLSLIACLILDDPDVVIIWLSKYIKIWKSYKKEE